MRNTIAHLKSEKNVKGENLQFTCINEELKLPYSHVLNVNIN